MKFRLPFPRHNKTAFIHIYPALCKACRQCVIACPRQVLGIIAFGRHRHVRIDRAQACTGCCKCIAACPTEAIRSCRTIRASARQAISPKSSMNVAERSFNIRAFVALMIAFSGVGLPITGLANHHYGFSPLTVARHAWMSAHNILGLLFLIFGIWHVVLNRRALWNHIKGVSARVPAMSREALLAGAVVGLALLLFVGHAFHGRQ